MFGVMLCHVQFRKFNDVVCFAILQLHMENRLQLLDLVHISLSVFIKTRIAIGQRLSLFRNGRILFRDCVDKLTVFVCELMFGVMLCLVQLRKFNNVVCLVILELMLENCLQFFGFCRVPLNEITNRGFQFRRRSGWLL